MTIKIRPEPDVYVTASALAEYRREYQQAYKFYAGTPPTLNEYIAQRQRERTKLHDRD